MVPGCMPECARILVLCKVGFFFFFLLVCAVAGMGYAEEIVSIFRKGDPAVVATGAAALRWQFITYPLGAWIVVSNMMLQTHPASPYALRYFPLPVKGCSSSPHLHSSLFLRIEGWKCARRRRTC